MNDRSVAKKEEFFRTLPEYRNTRNTDVVIPPRKDDDDRWKEVCETLRKDWKTLKKGIANRDPKKILIGGRGIWIGTTIVTLRITGDHPELVTYILDVLYEMINTVKKSNNTTNTTS